MKRSSFVLLALMLAVPQAAGAEPTQPIGGAPIEPIGGPPSGSGLSDRPPRPVRPQRFALELKGGAYSPDIDSTPGLTGKPFSDLFNDQYGDSVGKRPPGKPIFGVEFDWQFWHPFGSLALGASVSFSRRTAHSFQYSDPSGQPCTVPNCTPSGDETALTVLPIELLLVYRFDVLALKWRIPLVPYMKVGLAYYFWFIQRGDSSLAKSFPDESGNTSSAIGGTPGLVLHPGLSIMLDAISRSTATALHDELHIKHMHAFAELNYGWITGLGIWKDKIVLSDTTWSVGLAFEF